MQGHDKVYAAVRIVPLSYGGSYNCDHLVVSRRHFSFQTSMVYSKLQEIKRSITNEHGEGVVVTENACGNEVVLTVAYHPEYFGCFSDPRPFQCFIGMIENLWWNALADYQRLIMRSRSKC